MGGDLWLAVQQSPL